MPPTLVYIYGPPAVGKLTIAGRDIPVVVIRRR
jgi:hypothetical protein